MTIFFYASLKILISISKMYKIYIIYVPNGVRDERLCLKKKKNMCLNMINMCILFTKKKF